MYVHVLRIAYTCLFSVRGVRNRAIMSRTIWVGHRYARVRCLRLISNSSSMYATVDPLVVWSENI